MSSSDSPTARREFIGTLAASAIVLAGTACAAPVSAVQTVVTPPPAPGGGNTPPPAPAAPAHWDDSWFARLTAKHKAVFDSPDFGEGIALSHATGYIRGMREAVGAGPDDVQTVIVMRHHAIPMAFNDAMWTKYAIGEERKVKDAKDKWATRNPFAAAEGPSSGADRPQANLAWLAAHGQILLGCDMATRGYAGIIAGKTKGDSRAVYEELKASLLPGVILQPTGVYAVLRAQEAGCAFFRST
jgi:hypothetical protein